ncbi:MAG: 3-carboxy-cis,cis-muconate cycloisomerase [Chloroflexota bacterium]
MSYVIPNSRLLSPLFGDAELEAIFSDDYFIDRMVQVESQLAQVQGALGIIPQSAAATIQLRLSSFKPDYAGLQADLELSGIPTKELIRQLKAHVGQTDAEAANFIHWGATTQDIMDTALVLQAREGLAILENRLTQLIAGWAQIADQHRHTLMAGRTHSQQALPITFGLKVANWIAPHLRHRQRLAELKPRLLVLQFGGAAGTLASLGDRGAAVQTALAERLDLQLLPLPWHTQRDNIVEAAGWLSMVTGSLAKMAQDIILMAQSEVGELRESGDPKRGGSSTMPQKANPVISETIIAASRSNTAALATLHQAQIQEHERATHGWQLEWMTLPQMFILTGNALQKGLFLSENIVINQARMSQNVANSWGTMLAEKYSFVLAKKLGRSKAKAHMKTASEQAIQESKPLIEILKESEPEIDWESVGGEETYLGETQRFIDALLSEIA